MTRDRSVLMVCFAVLLMLPAFVAAAKQSEGPVLAPGGAVKILAAPADKCNGLDVVFLIDQSGSMQSYNDKNANRAEAVRYALSRIGENPIYFCPGMQHRVAVIGFWDAWKGQLSNEVYIEPTVIAPDANHFTEWEELRQALSARVKAEAKGPTDFISAFEQASSILSSWRGNPIDTAPRKQAVVLITDGGPCPIEQELCRVLKAVPTPTSARPVTSTVATQEKDWKPGYLAEMEKLLSPDGNSFPWIETPKMHGVYIWLVAFNDSSNPDYDYLKDEALMGTWRRITASHGGDILILQKGKEAAPGETAQRVNTDLAPKLTEILDKVLGSELIKNKCGEPISVPAYLDGLILHVFKIGSDPKVNINDVKITVTHERRDGTVDTFRDGQARNGSGDIRDYTVNGPTERYVFGSPDPGAWRVMAEGANICRDVDVRFQEMKFGYRVVRPGLNERIPQIEEPPHYDPQDPVLFQYRITEKLSDKPILLIDGYPLSVSARVQWPMTGTQGLQLERQTDGSYLSQKPLEVPQAGIYSWQVRAVAPSVDTAGAWSEVISDTGSFEVTRVTRFGFEIIEPKDNQDMPLNEIVNGRKVPVPVVVTVRLIDPSGQSLTATNIIARPDQPVFTATIEGPGIREQKTFGYDPQQNAFQCALRTAEVITTTLDTPGDYHVKVELMDNYVTPTFRPRYRVQEGPSFHRYYVTPVDYRILSPGGPGFVAQQPLYQGCVGCVGATVVPVPVAFALFDPDHPQTALDPTQIAIGDPARAFSVTFVNPANEAVPVALSLQTGEDGARLVGITGLDNPVGGKHIIRVAPSGLVLKPQYQPVRTVPIETEIVREDRLLNRPSTCKTVGLLLVAVAVAIVIFRLWNIIVRPVGTITCVDQGTQAVLHTEVLGRPLRGWWRRYRSTDKRLKEWCKIGRLEVIRAGRSDLEALGEGHPEEYGGSIRAIKLSLWDVEGAVLAEDEVLRSGGEFDIDGDTMIRYD